MSTVVITGTNRGLGLAFVRHYLKSGWDVVSVNRRVSNELVTLGDSPGLTLLEAELTDALHLERIAAELASTDIDLLINNAGIMGASNFRREGTPRQGLADFARDEWRAVFEINLFTPMHLTALLQDRLVEGARVVTISSIMGSIASNTYGGWYAYRASKAAVNCLMKSISLDLSRRNIVAIALHPGWVRTDMGGPDADIDPETAIDGMTRVIAGLQPGDSGKFLAWNGTELDY